MYLYTDNKKAVLPQQRGGALTSDLTSAVI